MNVLLLRLCLMCRLVCRVVCGKCVANITFCAIYCLYHFICKYFTRINRNILNIIVTYC